MRAFLFFSGLALLLPGFSFAAVIPSARSGPWSAPSTWQGAAVPGDGDDAIISDGHTVTIDRDIGSPVAGLKTVQVGQTDGSTAGLKFDGAASPKGVTITFADGLGRSGIDFFGTVDLEGTADHPLTMTPRSPEGDSYLYLRKNPGSTHLRLILKNNDLRSLGDESHPAVDARNAKGGDRVIFSGNRLDRSGTLQLAGADGSLASITVSGNTATRHKGSFVQFQAAKNLTIDGNQITLSSFPAGVPGQAVIDSIKGDGVGSGVTIQNNILISEINADTLHFCASNEAPPQRFGIWLQGFTDSVVRGNRILAQGIPEGCATYPGFFGFAEGIHLLGDGHGANIMIEGNTISDTIHGIGVTTGPADVNIQLVRNTLFDNRNEHIFIETGSQIVIANNILYGFLHSGQAGILLYKSDQVQILNNTLDGLGPDGAAQSAAGIAIGDKKDDPPNGILFYTSTNVTIINNILTHWDKGIQNRDSNNTFRKVGYNLFFGDAILNHDLADSPANRLPAGRPGEILQDPRYVDPASRNYHLQAGSPAIDRGGAPNPANDLDGDARPQGNGIDIGADEFTASPPPPAAGGGPGAGDSGGSGTSGGTGGGAPPPGGTDPPTVLDDDGGGGGCALGDGRSADASLIFFPGLLWLLYRVRKRNGRAGGLLSDGE